MRGESSNGILSAHVIAVHNETFHTDPPLTLADFKNCQYLSLDRRSPSPVHPHPCHSCAALLS